MGKLEMDYNADWDLWASMGTLRNSFKDVMKEHVRLLEKGQ
jgi:hypothetical protein